MPTALKLVLIVLAALVLAVVARLVYVAQNAPVPQAEAEIRVRVAASDLPAGLLLREEDLNWNPMAVSTVPRQAITERSRQTLEGALLRRSVKAGAILSTDDILSPEAPGFLAAALPPNMRAVSIPVNDVSSNAGLIRPGDHVDIILTQDLRGRSSNPGANSVVSETIVQNARVIAVGSRLQTVEGESNRGDNRIRTVTFQVAPGAAEVIAIANRLGTLSLALRSFAIVDRQNNADTATVSAWSENAPAPVWARDISQALEQPNAETVEAAPPSRSAPTTPSLAPSRNHTVTIIRGTSSSTSTWEPQAGAALGAKPQNPRPSAANQLPGALEPNSTAAAALNLGATAAAFANTAGTAVGVSGVLSN